MVTKKKRLVKKKRLTEPNFIVITDREEDYENCLCVEKFRTKNQLKKFLVEYDKNKCKCETIEIYKIGKKIEFTVQTNVEHLVELDYKEN